VLLSDGDNTTIKRFGDYAAPEQKAANFVVDAFNEFRESYRSISESTAIPYPTFLDGLVPKKSYVDFDRSYEFYISELIDKILQDIEPHKSKIKNFEDFIEVMRQASFSNLREKPLTRSGFLHSVECPINVSGLCVELTDLPYDVDSEKGQMIQTREFSCYADLAKAAGFYIDKNAPWRLIANLESESMKERIKGYQQNTTPENILSRVFRTKTHYDDYDALKKMIQGCYAAFLSKSPFYSYVSIESGAEIKRKALRDVTSGPAEVEYWLATLLEVRMRELNMDMSLFEKRKREVLDRHAVYSVKYKSKLLNESIFFSLKPALGRIGQYCSEHIRKTYESRGTINSYEKVTIKDYD